MTTQKIEIKDLGKTVEVTKKAGDIDQQAVTGAVQEHKSVERKFDTIQRQSADREIQLRQAAAKPQPAASGVVAVGSAAVTPVSEYKDSVPTELEGQIGLLRLTSLWQAYCLAAPAAAECKEAAQ